MDSTELFISVYVWDSLVCALVGFDFNNSCISVATSWPLYFGRFPTPVRLNDCLCYSCLVMFSSGFMNVISATGKLLLSTDAVSIVIT